jgi:voltage-dependent anion channel protein 2
VASAYHSLAFSSTTWTPRLINSPLHPLQDLGKSASDLLLKDYPIHGTSLEVKTSSYPTTFKVAGTRDAKSAAIAGDIEGKYVDFKNGIVFTQAWTTTNLLRTQVELENQIAKGLKLDLATTLNPAKAQKSAIVTAIYKQPSLHTRATVDLFKVSWRWSSRGLFGAGSETW